MKTLSIIIPMFNMEDYIKHCLDSLVTVSADILNYIEILVINDGSKDGSLRIATIYQNKYPQTIRVIDKENGNYGSCINIGLSEATGKYVKILDSDDSFNTDGLSKIIQQLNSVEITDLVITDYVVTDIINKRKTSKNFKLMQGQLLIFDNSKILKSIYGIQMHAIIYRTNLLKEINYRQTEGISYTDQEWCFYPMVKVQTMRYYAIELYDYLIGREGQTMSPASIKRMIKHLIIIAEKMLDYFSNIDKTAISKKHYLYLKNRITVRYKDIYHFFLLTLPKNDFVAKDFNILESNLKTKSKKIYWEVGLTSVLHKLFPIPFVLLYRLLGIRL